MIKPVSIFKLESNCFKTKYWPVCDHYEYGTVYDDYASNLSVFSEYYVNKENKLKVYSLRKILQKLFV